METQEARFWNLVRRVEGDACWEWQGPLDHKGYGHIRYDGRTIGAHRAALEISNRRRVPRELVVCHVCDNRMCVRPSHLWADTKSANTRDAFQKGRIPPQGNRWKR